MDRTGLGLLPGMALALLLALAIMLGLLVDSPWAVFAVLAALLCIAVAVVVVVLAVLDDDSPARWRIPGLGHRAR